MQNEKDTNLHGARTYLEREQKRGAGNEGEEGGEERKSRER